MALPNSDESENLNYANFLATLDPSRGTELDIALRDPRGKIYRLGALIDVEQAILDQKPRQCPDVERLSYFESLRSGKIMRTIGFVTSSIVVVKFGPDLAEAGGQAIEKLSRYFFGQPSD